MFRKLKDKIAEEVKSSPQRLQQFAQAAQAAVTSASTSSSISDITNNDLFTIDDDGADTPKNSPVNKKINLAPGGFQDVSLSHSPSPLHSNSSNDKQETADTLSPLINNHYSNPKTTLENFDNGSVSSSLGIYPQIPTGNRIRKLSNSSTASDVSFRLPSYESPGSMFHLQSDLDISASEIEDNVSIPAQLERVSKEHLYAAYRRTNEKYNKYRGRYTDLARHYKSLERENAKARAVLVETQDKALRRISELREQCQLEQSAKAHLENALRLELDERNLKIEAMNTKIQLLQSYSSNIPDPSNHSRIDSSGKIDSTEDNEVVSDLVNINENLSSADNLNQNNESESIQKQQFEEIQNKHCLEIQNLNNKLQKLEQLLEKCKETIKTHKEKNLQLTNEIQIISNQLEKRNSENEQLSKKVIELTDVTSQLDESKEQILKLKNELETFENKKQSEISSIKSELTTATDEISQLNSKIKILNQREEENVISLAENKLSIHKELEGKENEIKSLNEKILKLNADVKGNEIVIADLKHKLKDLDDEKCRFKEQLASFDETREHISTLEGKIKDFRKKNQEFEAKYSALIENFKCTELQLKQEADEKLATIDRNNFLESRNKQLSEDCTLKNKHIIDLENEISNLKKTSNENDDLFNKHQLLLNEHTFLKSNFDRVVNSEESLKSEIIMVNDKLIDMTQSCEKLTAENAELFLNVKKYCKEVEQLTKLKEDVTEVNFSLEKELKLLKDKHLQENNESKLIVEQLKTELKNASSSIESQELQSLKELKEDFRKQLDISKLESENKYQKILQEYNVLKDQYESLNKRCEMYSCENEKNIQVIASLEESLSKISIEKALSDEQVQAFETKLNMLQKDHEELMLLKENMEQKLSTLENENQDIKSKFDSTIDDINSLQNELSSLRNLHSEITSEKEKIEEKIVQMEQLGTNKIQENDNILHEKNAENESLNIIIKELKSENEKITSEKNKISKQLNENVENIKKTELKLKEYSENNELWQLKLSNILDDNNSLQEKCGKFKLEKDLINEKVSVLEQKLAEHDAIKIQFEEAKLEKEFLDMKISQLHADIKQIHAEKNQLISDNESMKIEHSKSITSLHEKIDSLQESVNKSRTELQNINAEKINIETILDAQVKENNELALIVKNFNDKSNEHEELLAHKTISETKIEELTSALTNLRCSSEKEIENLRHNLSTLQQANEFCESKSSDFNELEKKYDELKTDSDRLNVKIRVLEQVELEYLELTEKMHSLKEENVKLQANIEGLQIHLTKLSKDNSELNDRLRQLLANGEVIQAKHQQNLESSSSLSELSEIPLDQAAIELQLKKFAEMNSQLLEQLKSSENLSNRITDLERQNSILIEEKLELEDQLKTSMDRHDMDDYKPVNDSKNAFHENVIKEKMELESQLAHLELINRSNDSNMRILEQKNEKLKLNNEKLERRLDETLVSLNHIRTLEENTELEYLRNILYEYLTGPTNNNMVLAKVLSAVVKFDHRQTQLVLEREKERQGVLGQLGLL